MSNARNLARVRRAARYRNRCEEIGALGMGWGLIRWRITYPVTWRIIRQQSRRLPHWQVDAASFPLGGEEVAVSESRHA